jgi:hypothetical protein
MHKAPSEKTQLKQGSHQNLRARATFHMEDSLRTELSSKTLAGHNRDETIGVEVFAKIKADKIGLCFVQTTLLKI